MRIIEHGPDVGTHKGRGIPGYIISTRGDRFDFDRIAVLDLDGAFELDRLAPDEAIIAPGLIYRRSKR